jgi:L-alanine-DL-glutamate epimerase-like enolase superfamily enzyme
LPNTLNFHNPRLLIAVSDQDAVPEELIWPPMSSVHRRDVVRDNRASRPTDIRVQRVALYLLPVSTRLPLKFGAETLTSVTCARVKLLVADRSGNTAEGWGETPLSVQWAWPGSLSHAERHQAMIQFCERLTAAWLDYEKWGHPLEVGNAFQVDELEQLEREFNFDRAPSMQLPHLAAIVCCAPFDMALHDAFGVLHRVPVYETYTSQYLNTDLADFLSPAPGVQVCFQNKYPGDFLAPEPDRAPPVWHLVGGLDPLEPSDLSGGAVQDGYPTLLGDWIDRDGLFCLKVKLRGNDAAWDYDRLVRVGRIGLSRGVQWLSADFNCTVQEPAYVNDILDRLRLDERQVFDMILYVEQPFAYELAEQMLDVRSVAGRKTLFLDESAHNWRFIMLGQSLGWNGVALKTCKTQTEAILSLCWARAHGMALMVQDLTNPMLAQIPHVMLAAHGRTIMGVECNAMQFYPDASSFEARVHPGVYTRRNGRLQLSTIQGPGFGYRVKEIARPLPVPTVELG